MPRKSEVISAAVSCEIRGNHAAAVSLYWIAVRDEMFHWLDNRSIAYNSTETALLGFIQNVSDMRIRQHVYELYHIVILIEYNQPKLLADPLIERYTASSKSIIKWFSGDFDAVLPTRDVMLLELDEHVNDSTWSLTSHFICADAFEKLHSRAISYPLVAGSAFLAVVNVGRLHNLLEFLSPTGDLQQLLSEIVAVIVLSLSLLNATVNWSSRSQRHRSTANKYIAIKRDARQLKVEIESCTDPVLLQSVMPEKINGIKISLNNAAAEAPQIPEWAFKAAQSQLGEENLHVNRARVDV